MWSSRIKENSSGDRVDVERTQHNFWCLLSCIRGYMVHLHILCWLLVAAIPLRRLLILLLRIVERHMSLFSTVKTLDWSVGSTILHRSCIGIPWTRHLLTTLLLIRGTLPKMLALISLLHLILRTLRIWSMISLTNWSLESLLQVRTLMCVASRGLSLQAPLSIHVLVHAIKHNGTIH
jgi:hypothetical protein